MLYERQIISDITDGGGSLPSVLRINTTRYKDAWIASEGITAYSDDTGTIGNGYFQYAIDFCDASSIKAYAGTRMKDLRSRVTEQSGNCVLSFSKQYFTDNFFVLKIPDYGMQTMTLNNYDVELKVFDTNGNKIPSSCVAMLRFYTEKQIYVIIDNNGNNQSMLELANPQKYIGMMIIDFTYRRDIMNNNFEAFNSYQNLQEYINDPFKASPYLDLAYSSNKDTGSVLNQQHDYFQLLMNKNISNYKPPLTKTKTNASALSVENSQTFSRVTSKGSASDYYNYNVKTQSYSSFDQPIDSLQTEVYEYSESSNGCYIGKRVLPGNSISQTSVFIETYTLLPKYIRHLMSLQPTTKTTVAAIFPYARAFLKKNNVFMWNSDFKNIVFIDQSGCTKPTFINSAVWTIEIILPITETTDSETKDTEIATDESDIIVSQKITGSLLDYRSKYDITATSGQNDYNQSKSIYLPYLYNDQFVKSALVPNEAALIITLPTRLSSTDNKTTETNPATDLDVTQIKKMYFNTQSKPDTYKNNMYFDIVPVGNNDTEPSDPISLTGITKFSHYLASRNQFAASLCESSGDTNASNIANKETQEKTIMSNLLLLLPKANLNNANNWTSVSSAEISTTDCVAIFVFETNQATDAAKSLKVKVSNKTGYTYEYLNPIEFGGTSFYVVLPKDFNTVQIDKQSCKYFKLH